MTTSLLLVICAATSFNPLANSAKSIGRLCPQSCEVAPNMLLKCTMRSRHELVMLVAAPYIRDYGPMRKAAGTYFPLGIGYISAFIKKHGYAVRFIDPNVTEYDIPAIVAEAVHLRPVLFGISFMTPQFTWARTLAAALQQRCPSIPCVVGGAHPSAMPERTLEEIQAVDYVVYGEGEETTLELLEQLTEGRGSMAVVAGLAWRHDGRVVLNAPRAPVRDLDLLPYPDRDLIDQSLYNAQSFLSYSRRAMAIHTARGCPARCVYCASGHKLRSPVRWRSISSVMGEIGMLRRRYGMEYLLIKDDTFTWRKSRVKEFCAALKAQHPGLKWHCMGRVNTVDRELLVEMKDAGLNDIFFGIESGNDEVLRRSGKGTTSAMARQAVDACAEIGIRTYGAFILGLPGDTAETIEQTIDFACSLPLTLAGFSILIPYPGTKVFEEHYVADAAAPIDFDAFIASTGIHYVDGYTGMDGVSVKELPRLISTAQRRFYLRPHRILRLLRSATPSMLLGYVQGAAALLRKELFLLVRAR